MIHIHPNRDCLIELTAAWGGDRFESGWPRVSDHVLRRLHEATIEEVCQSCAYAATAGSLLAAASKRVQAL